MRREDGADTRVGTVFAGKYRLRRVLGHGGMGAVYAAIHGFTNKRCAVKVLDPSMSAVPGYAARFLREARAAADIGHPCICDVFDAGQDPSDGSLYLVLELLEGEDLGAAIRRGDLTPGEVARIGAQVCHALAAAHARGIVHRDVKPENVFLTRDDHGELRVKLLDFGVAKQLEGEQLFSTQQGQIIGTPYYMAPEQAGGEEVDGRADVWSVGAMLFHALAGRPPHEGSNYNRLILEILSKPPPSLRAFRPDLPEWLLRLVDGALQMDRAERWQSAAQMAAALETRGEVPMGLEWEGYEEATVRTDSPFETAGDTIPPVPLASLTPSGQHRRPGTPPPSASGTRARSGISDRPTLAGEEALAAGAAGQPREDEPTKAQRPVAIQYEQRRVAPGPERGIPTPAHLGVALGAPQAVPGAGGRRRGGAGFLVGVLVGVLLAAAGGVGLTWYFLRPAVAPPPVPTVTAQALDALDGGMDAGGEPDGLPDGSLDGALDAAD